MKLNETTLGWTLAGGVALVTAAAVLLTLARARGTAGRPSCADSWERSEERRHKKEVLYGAASYTLLFCCAAVAAALSFHGLVGFGVQNLSLSGGWQYLVPFGLDGAAMFCSVLAVREASYGDAALGSRLLVWLFAGASAWFNWVHAPRGGGHNGAPQFFAGMSLSAAILFDRALKQTRRAALREQGLVPRPLPQIRIVRWLRAPRETYAAWSLMLLEGVRSLDEAVEEVREDKRERLVDRERQRITSRHERAQLKALSRRHRAWARGRRTTSLPQSGGLPRSSGGRQLNFAGLDAGSRADAAKTAAVEPTTAAGSTGLLGSPTSPSRTEQADADTTAPTRTDASTAPGAAGAAAGAAASEQAPVVPIHHRPAWGRPARGKADDAVSGAETFDLTAEDDTQTLPRLDSLEQKLKDLEQLYG